MELLYIDRFKPKDFESINYNKSVIEQLKKISSNDDISHIILNGSNGSSRNIMANLYLNYKYNNGKELVTHTKSVVIKIKTSNTKEIRVVYSNYHLQLNPSQYGVYDRIIIKEYVNDIIRTMSSSGKYITIIIEDADKLTIDAQESLRRSLEKEMSNCRFIFLVDQTSTIIEALLSRFLTLRLSLPTNEQIYEVLKKINDSNNPDKLFDSDETTLRFLSKSSNRNLKESINGLNLYHQFGTIINFENDKIDEIISIFKKNPNVKSLDKIRTILYELLIHCVDPFLISQTIHSKVINEFKFNNTKFEELINTLTLCNDSIKDCNKPFFHLERYIISLIIIIIS